MRVWSWNVYCYNKKPQEVLDFVRSRSSDIVCLQEVPETLLSEIESLFPFSAHAVDSTRIRYEEKLVLYNVILSPYPLSRAEEVHHTDVVHPFRTKMTIRALAREGWSKSTGRNAVTAIADTPIGRIQLFSAHLTLTSPTNRAREFSDLLAHATTLPKIIAGDFNIIERPRIKVLNWFLGASLYESLPWFPERAQFEERFENAGLGNPLRGTITHHFSHSQLDHILVPKIYVVDESGVHHNMHGSDHKAVFVEIAPHA